VEISVVDHDLRVVSSEKISIPIAGADLVIDPKSDRVLAESDAPVHIQPLKDAPVFGTLKAGSKLSRTGQYKAFSRVMLGEGRIGYVDNAALESTSDAEAVSFEPALTRSPPLLEVSPASLATRSATVKITGVASDGDQVRDAYVFVGARKVFYMSNRKASEQKKLPFAFDAELQPGVNIITVVARENEDVATAQTLVVRRDGPSGEALPTPKRDNFAADWEFEED
jgi:carboxyl-terminal processing protease